MKLKYEIKLMLSPTPTHTREICMCGTHNGYLALPEGHPWFGMDYNKIPADVHGGLTYGAGQTTIYSDRSESPSMWVIGFDTCHWGDKPEVQDINFVWAELLSLHDQAQQATAEFCECGGGYCEGYCDFAMAEQNKYYDSVGSAEATPATVPLSTPTPKPTPVPPTKATKFYHFSQNNSGGSFVVNERVGNDVVIEAHDADHANTIAVSIGIYFDGGCDCPCCGNRWSEAYEADGESFPHYYGERLETLSASHYRSEVYVYYLGSDKPEITKLS